MASILTSCLKASPGKSAKPQGSLSADAKGGEGHGHRPSRESGLLELQAIITHGEAWI